MGNDSSHLSDQQNPDRQVFGAGLELPAIYFAQRFGHWGIRLPPEAAVTRRGEIGEKGWGINWVVGKTKRGVYLEFYAGHRMTDDSHERIYEDGTVEYLEVLPSFCKVSVDPIENEKIQRDFAAEKQRIWRSLTRRGLWSKMSKSSG